MSLTVFGDHEERTIRQLERCVRAEDGAAGVLCADGHVGYSQPVGGAVAYRKHISVSGVGYDIGCGNKAVRTDLRHADIAPDLPRIMDAIVDRISFGVGRRNDDPVDHPVLDAIRTADVSHQRKLYDLAAKQLGTVGAGNHYVDLFADEEGFVWVGVHFGSRGFGHKTASGFLALAQGLRFDARAHEGEMDAPPTLLATDSDLGQAYIAAMNLAGDYAYAGRDVVVARVLDILGASETYAVHNHHNYCVAGDQIVPTTRGPRRMDEIRPSELVYAFDAERGLEPTRVIDHWSSGTREIYSISMGSRRIRCSGSHPLLVVDDGLRWRRADEIRPGQIVVCAEGSYEHDRSWGADRAGQVGAFLGGGWLRHDPARQGDSPGLAMGTGAEPHTARYAELAQAVLPDHGWGGGRRLDASGHHGLPCSSKSAWSTALDMGLAIHGCVVATDSMAEIPLKASKRRTTRHGRPQGLAARRLGGVELPYGTFARRVVSVEIQPAEPVYDLTVEHPSHSFVVEGVVTHNCWRETHNGEEWWVVRKGCTPAFPGQQGFVGSTMGETSVILEGADTAAARAAFFSTVHGAGRRLSRTQAAGKMGVAFECSVRDCDFWVPRGRKHERCPRHPDARLIKRRRRIKRGLIDYGKVQADLRARGIELRGGDADEAPDAYKRLDAVLADHGDSIRVLHRLTPIGVAMAGSGTFDPYKD